MIDQDPATEPRCCAWTEESALIPRFSFDGSRHPIYVLNHLFLSGPSICVSAMDANEDDTVDLADALYLLLYLNGIGSQPPAPFPTCGTSESELECEQFIESYTKRINIRPMITSLPLGH